MMVSTVGSDGWFFRCSISDLAAVLGLFIEFYDSRGLQMSTAGVYLAAWWLSAPYRRLMKKIYDG